MIIARSIAAALLIAMTPALACAELPAPELISTSPAINAVVSVPIEQLRFDFAQDVHLFNVQLVKIFETRTDKHLLFQADGAYLLGKSFVFPLQQPITRPGTFRLQVMAQPTDNGQSASTIWEFTVLEPAAKE
jgi:hypothetical protein